MTTATTDLSRAPESATPARYMPAYNCHRFWLYHADEWLREVHAARPERRGQYVTPAGQVVTYADDDSRLLMAEYVTDFWRQRWGCPPMLRYGSWWPWRGRPRYAHDADAAWSDHDLAVTQALAVLNAYVRLEPVPAGANPPAWESRLLLATSARYPSWPPAGPGPREVLAAWMDDRAKLAGHARTRILHEDYRAWCEARGRDPQDETWFGTMLTGLGYPSRKIGGRMHRGLSLLPA